MHLYELTSEQLYINQLLEENGGELTEELMSLMEVNETNFNGKIEGYCKAIKIMESNLIGVKSEIERLQKMKKTYENSIERMKERYVLMIEISSSKRHQSWLKQIRSSYGNKI